MNKRLIYLMLGILAIACIMYAVIMWISMEQERESDRILKDFKKADASLDSLSKKLQDSIVLPADIVVISP